MRAPLPASLYRRHAPACVMASLVLAGHLALGLALGPSVRPTPSAQSAPPMLVTVQLAGGAVPAPEPVQRPAPAAPAPQPQKDEAALLPIVTIAAPHYYPALELSEYPDLIEDVRPELGQLELTNGPDQFALLSLLINEFGAVDRVEVIRSELSDAVIAAAVAAYSRLRFHPGKIGENAVKSRITIEVRLENVVPA